jgi:FMN phosphatase YigB (HAD superfamily)
MNKMKKTTVLFDLDGTLIGMNQDEFIRLYFIKILDKLTALGYDKDGMYKSLEAAIRATKRNDGTITNEARFWQTFDEASGGLSEVLKRDIGSFYENEFISVLQGSCYPFPRAGEIIECARRKGLKVVLATNPLFPAVATHRRIRLGGMSPDDFDYITAYENSSACKPNPEYFRELLEKLGVSADECVMVGNDTKDDFCAHALGIPVFILTECLINQSGIDLDAYPHGGFDDLISYIRSI